VKKRATIYIALVSLIGILLGIGCCYEYLYPFISGEKEFAIHMFAIPLLVCVLCRSLPINVRDDETLDLSVISVLAIYLTNGPAAAVTTYMIASLFTFEPSHEAKRKYNHYFRIGFEKVLFNDSTIILSIIIPHLIIRLISGWNPGSLSMPAVLLPTALFSILTFVTNGLLQLTMFCLNGNLSFGDMLHMLIGLTPNVIAAMPMGLLMGFGFSDDSYIWFVFILLFPLLLARYAWKLYLASESARANLNKAFINTIEAKDKYTQGHSARVAEYSVQIAQEIKLKKHQVDLIRQGAVLHDIGKIGIADSVLNKPGKLDPDEWEMIQRHPLIGVKVLEEVGLEPEILEMVRSHHERFDGKGYPDRIAGTEICLAARILCVADSYDAMTSDRPYRKGMSTETAQKILIECKGTQFDPLLVDAFIRVLEKKQ